MSLGSHRALLAAAGGGVVEGDPWEYLHDETLSSATATVTFTSAGANKSFAGFKHLVAHIAIRSTNNHTYNHTSHQYMINEIDAYQAYKPMRIQHNYSHSASSYEGPYPEGGNKGNYSVSPGSAAAANAFGHATMYFHNINSDKPKHVSSMWFGFGINSVSSPSSGYMTQGWYPATVLGSEDPIERIDFVSASGYTYAAGSRFALFGI